MKPLIPHPCCASGSHTLQKMIGCDILEDGSIRGYVQYAFDGRDFLAFDMDTMTFTAADPVAEITKRRWEEEGTYAERWKHELGTVCVQNLRRYLEHGKAALKRRGEDGRGTWGWAGCGAGAQCVELSLAHNVTHLQNGLRCACGGRRPTGS